MSYWSTVSDRLEVVIVINLGDSVATSLVNQSWETCRPRTRGPPPPGVALGWNTAPEQVLNTKTSDPWNIRINSLSNQLHRLSGFITFGTVICFGDKRVLLVTAGRSEHEQQFFGQTEEQKLNRS